MSDSRRLRGAVPAAERIERAARTLRAGVRDIADFPTPGVGFKDIAPVLRDPAGLASVIDGLHALFDDVEVDLVAGIESRGFLLAAPLALATGCGLVLIRKAGKLPGEVKALSYDLEYGSAVLEVQAESFSAEAHGRRPRVLLVDDVMATGGTAAAAASLVEQAGGEVVGVGVLIELAGLRGEAAGDLQLRTLIQY